MENLVNSEMWKGKRVMVTGHTGFKGSWLSLWLQTLGAKVIGYALDPPTTPNLFEVANVAEGMTSIYGDVRDLDQLDHTIASEKPDVVIHMAAQALVRRSYEKPIQTLTTNIIGTANVLDAVRRSDSVRVVVCITSDKCYENCEWYWGYRETERLGGHDPYSGSKASAELVIAAFRSSFFPPEAYPQHRVALASTRAGNVIGGGDWASDRLVPDIMNAMLAGKEVSIRNPNATRPWQFVLEPLSGYLMLAEKLWTEGPSFAQAWNFGPSDDYAKPVSFITEFLTSKWDSTPDWVIDSGNHPHENTYLKLDSSKARTLLGWAPKLDLPTTLEWIVEWYRAYQNGQDIRRTTESQINRYQKL